MLEEIELPEGLVVLHGAELNIGRDGSLDYDDEVLARLEFGVAGIHSNFGLDRDEQTARLIRAIEHPAVRVIAHPTTRRLGSRPPIDFDIEAVLDAAARTDTALEVNGHLDRLDLSADLARRAVAAGVAVVADSDAHRPDEMGNVANAVAVLQRAGVPPEGVGQCLGRRPADRMGDPSDGRNLNGAARLRSWTTVGTSVSTTGGSSPGLVAGTPSASVPIRPGRRRSRRWKPPNVGMRPGTTTPAGTKRSS